MDFRKIKYDRQNAIFWALACFNIVMYAVVIPIRCL